MYLPEREGEAGRVAPIEHENESEIDQFISLKSTERILLRKGNSLEAKIQEDIFKERPCDAAPSSRIGWKKLKLKICYDVSVGKANSPFHLCVSQSH